MNENQYYNPIVQAMMHLSQTRMEQAKLQQNQQQHGSEQKIAQQRADQEEERIKQAKDQFEEMAEFHKQSISNENAVREAQVAQFHNNMRLGLANASREGTDLTKAYGPGSKPGLISVPGLGDVDPTAFQTQQQAADVALAQKVKETGAVTNAQQTALAPFVNSQREASDASESKKLYQEHLNKMDELDKAGQNTFKNRQAEDAAMLARTKYEVGGHIAAAKISAGLGDGSGGAGYAIINQAKPLVDSIFNGEVDGSKLSKQQKALVNIWSQNTGEQVPNTTDYYKKVRQLDPLGRIVNNATDMAINFSRDSPQGGLLAAAQSKIIGAGNLDAAKKSFNSDIGTVVSMMDDQQRKALPEFQRTLDGMYNSINNKQQNLGSVQSARGNIQSHIDGVLTGVNPDRKAIILQNHHLTDFYNPSQPSATNPQPQSSGQPTHQWTPNGIVPIGQPQQ